jgi:cell division protein FtsI/penicillin-binding protein 2
MIGRRRTALPLALLGIGAFVLLARLFQLQVLERSVWAEQAAGLVRSGEVVPFRRGEIRDARDTLMARDDTGHELVLEYREFRRGAPLGQVAHARSALELRAVSLDETVLQLEAWALELVSLSPRDLDQFARGAGLRIGTLYVAPTAQPELEDRRQRASDLWFYVTTLLAFDPPSTRAARKLEGDARARAFLDLAVDRGLASSPERARADLCARLATSLEDLRGLAALLQRAESAAPAGDAAWLIAELESARTGVEDLAASWAFEQACGFAAGRLEPELLLALDLEWLRGALRWEPRRLQAWAAGTRARWRSNWLLGQATDALAAECAQLPGRNWAPELVAEHVLSLCASVWSGDGDLERALADAPRSWREDTRALAWTHFAEIFASGSGGERIDLSGASPLPTFEAELRGREPDPEHPWALLEAASGVGDWGEIFALAREGERVAALRERLAVLLSHWESRLQSALRRRVEARLSALAADTPRRLELAADCIRRAEQGLPYALKDYGHRELRLAADPDFEALALIERAPARFRGFAVREEQRRDHLRASGEAVAPAWTLLGTVARSGNLGVDPLGPARRERLAALRRAPERDAAEDAELANLVGDLLLADQARGVAGIEACFDPWLRGRNGYRERLSLDDLEDSAGSVHRVREVEHGSALGLTLDLAAQRAAERVLAAPEWDPDEHYRDEAWLAEPTGAIVLMTVDGAIGVAASAPLPRSELTELSPAERARCIERALHAPGFQPPGSVFKPFVAAWSLDRLGLEPSTTVQCLKQDDGHAGYKGLRCSEASSHRGPIDLFHALKYSCNAYFAWVGERQRGSDLLEMASCFGFGEATGVRPAGAGGRIEDVPKLPTLARIERDRMRAANGLVVIQATPLQIARAFAGLATGVLPSARLVETVAGAPAPRGAARALPLAASNLELVRRALHAVAHEGGGTAHRALSVEQVGYDLAAKTGSADLEDRPKDGSPDVRKHAWVAGWLPAEQPRVVFVVFCADTHKTSSHSVVWIARQLLRDAEVRKWIDAQVANGGKR